MRFYRVERETVWSILQFIGGELNLPHNTILTDAYILIYKYHAYSIQQKKSGEINNAQLKIFKEGKLYKIITASLFHACKTNDNSKMLDDIFASLINSIQQVQHSYDMSVNVEKIIGLTSKENIQNKNFVINDDGNIELTDSFKHELICVYELLILDSICFSPLIYLNPFRYIKALSKKMILGNFQICEKVTYFIYLILKSSQFLEIPINIIVAAATEVAYKSPNISAGNIEDSKVENVPLDVEQWIKFCKNQNFPAFENAISICCYVNN